MGYMGFGMRKEVYTRKPKKAFGKIKEVYGDDAKTPKSKKKTNLKGPKSYTKHKYIPFNNSRPYVIFKRAIFLAIGVTIVWVAFLREPFFKYQQRQFELNTFQQYYELKLSSYQEVFRFLENRSDKVVSAGFDYNNRFDIYIKYEDLKPSIKKQNYDYIDFDGYQTGNQRNRDVIFRGTLTIEREGYLAKTYQNNWKYGLIDVRPNQIPNSVLDYLETNQQEFSNFLSNIKKNYESVYVKEDSVHTRYDHEKYGRYTFVYSLKELKNNRKTLDGFEYQTIVGKLEENVYWVREEKIKN